jgi:hypothetical protein
MLTSVTEFILQIQDLKKNVASEKWPQLKERRGQLQSLASGLEPLHRAWFEKKVESLSQDFEQQPRRAGGVYSIVAESSQSTNLSDRVFLEAFVPLFIFGHPVVYCGDSQLALQWSQLLTFKDQLAVAKFANESDQTLLWTHPSIRGTWQWGAREAVEPRLKDIAWSRMRARVYFHGVSSVIILDETGLGDFVKSRSEPSQLSNAQRILVLESIEKKAIEVLKPQALHTPLCEEVHHRPELQTGDSLNSVKYIHEFAKWINNPGTAESVEIWGDREKAQRLISKLEIGKAWINASWTSDEDFIFDSPQNFVGDLSDRFFGDLILTPESL